MEVQGPGTSFLHSSVKCNCISSVDIMVILAQTVYFRWLLWYIYSAHQNYLLGWNTRGKFNLRCVLLMFILPITNLKTKLKYFKSYYYIKSTAVIFCSLPTVVHLHSWILHICNQNVSTIGFHSIQDKLTLNSFVLLTLATENSYWLSFT